MGFEVEVEQLEVFEGYLSQIAQRPAELRDYLATHVCVTEPYGVGVLKPIGDFMAGEVLGWLDDFARMAGSSMAGTASALQVSAAHYAATEKAIEAGLSRTPGAAA